MRHIHGKVQWGERGVLRASVCSVRGVCVCVCVCVCVRVCVCVCSM